MSFDNTSIRYFIKEHGLLLTLRKRAKGAYNTTTGTVSYTNTDYSAYGFSYKNTPISLQDNSVIVATRKVILSNLQSNGSSLPEPKTEDQIIVDGSTFDIIKVMVVKSADKVVCYTLDVKG